jgi:hypothetical protein
MKTTKNALALAVAAALGAGALPAYAQVTGVAGESLLVPLVMNDPAAQGNGNQNTYVQIRVPQTLGQDLVLQQYTAPNVTADILAGTEDTVTQSPTHVDKNGNPYGWKIYWTVYDPWSQPIKSQTCYVSAGDSVLWTTDKDLIAKQGAQNQDPEIPAGTPSSICGTDNLAGRIGYVIFQTYSGADGQAADFAMEANAWIIDNNIANSAPALLSVPVMPMADGDDSLNLAPKLGINEISVGGTWLDGVPGQPNRYAPLAAGVRMNNGDGSPDRVYVDAGVQGPYGNQGYSMHVLWFDNNDNRRLGTRTLVWDEHEQWCDFYPNLHREVNVLVYNMSVTTAKGGASWSGISGGKVQDLALTDLVAAVYRDPNFGYTSGLYCDPANWSETIMGYAAYEIPESAVEAAGATEVRSAGAMFEAQEDEQQKDAWARHMMSARGFHPAQ